METQQSELGKTPASRNSNLASEAPTLMKNQQAHRSQKHADPDATHASAARLSDAEHTQHTTSIALQAQVTFEKPSKIGELKIRTTQFRDTPKQVSALQETKKKVSRFVELFRNADKNASNLDIELTEEIMRASKDLNSSLRPQTTKTGTLSGDVRDMMSSGAFPMSPTSTVKFPERRLQTGKPKSQVGLKHNFSRTLVARRNHLLEKQNQQAQLNSLQKKHAKSFGSQSIVQTSQQYKLAKNMPEVFKSLRKQEDNSQGSIFPIATMILSPKGQDRRGTSAAAKTRNQIFVTSDPAEAPRQSQQQASLVDYSKPAKHNFGKLIPKLLTRAENAQTSLGPHPDPYKYLQPTSHIKVPEFLKQQLSLQLSLNTVQSNLLPFSPASAMLPVEQIETNTESIEQVPTLSDRIFPEINTEEICHDSQETKPNQDFRTDETEKPATPKTVVFQKKPQKKETERLETMPVFSSADELADKDIGTFLKEIIEQRESFDRRRSQGVVSKNDLEVTRAFLASPFMPAPNTNFDLTLPSKGLESSFHEDVDQPMPQPQLLTTVHKLESRKDPNVTLPVSTDLIPQNLISKALHKLNKDFQWEHVADIPLHKTEDDNFFTDLHKVEREAISVLYSDLKLKRGSKHKQKHIGVDSEHKLPSSVHSASDPLLDSQIALQKAQQKFDYDEMLRVETNDDYSMMMFNKAICEKIKHPLFCLPHRPNVIETLYKDVMLTIMSEKRVDLYLPRSEDYLDDTKDAPPDVERSVTLKINYIKYQIEERTREAEQIKEKQLKERSRSSTSGFRVISMKRESDAQSTNQMHFHQFRPSGVQSPNFGFSLGYDSQKGPVKHNSRTPNRRKGESVHTFVDSETLELPEIEVNDCEKRRIVFSLVEAETSALVQVKLEVDFEAIMKLQRKIPLYQDKRIERVLPLYFFDDFEEECNSIKQLIEQRLQQEKPELQVQVTMKEEIGDGKQRRVIHTGKCLDYIQETKQFFVELESRKIVTSRLCVLFNDLERQQELEDRRVKAMILQKNAFVRLNIERIFVDEVLKMMPMVRQPAKITNGIIRRLGIPIALIEKNAVNRKKVKTMIEQAEALYCYSQVKAVAMAELEQENPKFACMITGYKVERNRTKKVPFYGLAASEKNGGPIQHFISKKQSIDILQNFSLAGRICFHEAMSYVNNKKLEFLDNYMAFCIPFDEKTLLLLSQRLNEPKRILQEKFSTFPQSNLQICEAQINMCHRYKTILQDNYYSRIISYVEKMIYREFPITTGSINAVKDVSQLNPFLLRFFNSLSSFQGGHLFAKLESELDRYLKFLLSFAARSLDFRASAESAGFKIAEFEFLLQKQAFVRIHVKTKKKVQRQDSHKRVELVKKQAVLQIIKQMKKDSDKYTVQTTPPIEDIYSKLMAVLHNICALFKDVRRPEKIVYPKLKLANDFIKISPAIEEVEPAQVTNTAKSGSGSVNTDQSKGDPMKSLDDCQIKKRYIEYIIGELMDLTALQVKELRSYTRYFGKTFDDFLRDCKQQVYEEHINNQLTDDSEEEQKSIASSNQSPRTLEEAMKKPEVTMEQVIKEINRIQLTDLNHEQFYQELQQSYMDLLATNKGEYDFGLTLIECKALKQRAVQDIENLIDAYQRYLVNIFDQMCTELLDRNIKIWDKIVANFSGDIDRTISQMQYIESLQSDDIVGETMFKLDRVQKYKFFLDKLRIQINHSLFEKCSELYRFPRMLEAQIKNKYEELQKQQGDIKKRIKNMSLEQKVFLTNLLAQFDRFKFVGLATTADIPLLTNAQNRNYLRDLNHRATHAGYRDQEKPGAIKIVWDANYVNLWKNKMLELMDAMKRAEDEIRLINFREEQLNIKTTQFPEMLKLRNDSRPMTQLWKTIISFNDNFEDWRNQTLHLLNIEAIEEEIAEWTRKLNFAQRSPEIAKQKGPMQFITYIREGIEYMKDFLPLLTAIKAKGLERRHFAMIQQETGADINLQKMTIMDLVGMNIHKGLVLEKIKIIADNATKEHSIKVTLEQVENDVYSTELTIIPYRDTGSYIIRGIDDFIQTLEECDQKNTTVAHSQFARHFKERIDRLDREIKELYTFCQCWKNLQKIWAYLMPIFRQKDLSSQMEREFTTFFELDRDYRDIMDWAYRNAKTFRIFASREGIIQQAQQMVFQLELLMKALVKYLEAKRKHFPRLYFLSNEEIIEIVGMVEDVFLLQRNLFKMFEGVAELKMLFTGSAKKQAQECMNIIELKKRSIFPSSSSAEESLEGIKVEDIQKKLKPQDLKIAQKHLGRKTYLQEKKEKLEHLTAKNEGVAPEIYGIKNHKGEEILFNQTITVTSCIEQWLKELETLMFETVAETVRNSVMSLTNELNCDGQRGFLNWIEKWPTQFLLISLEINLQRIIKAYFKKHDNDGITSMLDSQSLRLGIVNENLKRRGSLRQSTESEQVYQHFFKKLQTQVNNEIYLLTQKVKEQLDKNTRQKVNNLLITRVHHRDTIQSLLKTTLQNASSFLWSLFMKIECRSINQESYIKYLADQQKQQLDKVLINTKSSKSSNRQSQPTKSSERTSKRGKDDIPTSMKVYQSGQPADHQRAGGTHLRKYVGEIEIEIITATKPYGYEFLENSQRLVITPLTERAFQSLFLALHYDYGGAPIGPVGTGKTETIKEMSKRCARHCYVFNCQSGIDFESMSKFFKGLAASGTWTCFDEFNRLQIDILSIISQLIILIQEAKHAKLSVITIEGTEVQFEPECALFITMNPFQLGRTKLPDNLKALFRNITMVVPDSMFIAEIMLYSSGFIGAKNLSLKIQKTFMLAGEQLSSEKHYDFGLRAIKAVLVHAQQIKLRALKVKTNDMLEMEEAQQILNDYVSLFKAAETKKPSKHQKNVLQQRPVKKADKNRFNADEDTSEDEPPKELPKPKESLKLELTAITANEGGTLNRRNRKKQMMKDLTVAAGLDVDSLDLQALIPSSFESNEQPLLSSPLSTDKDKIERQVSVIKEQNELELLVTEDEGLSNLTSEDSVSAASNLSKCTAMKRAVVNIDKEYVMNTLGCDDYRVWNDEDALEEFIVLKSILDKNLPKLVANDAQIFKNILMDIFTKTPFPNLELNQIQDAIKIHLQSNLLHDGDEFVQGIISIYEAVYSRHGVMIVGEAMAGKSRSLQVMVDVLNKMHQTECQGLIRKFMIEKATRLKIPYKEHDGQIVPKYRDSQLEHMLKLKEEEIKIIKQTCKYKGIENRILNPKSVSIKNLMGNFEETSREWTDGLLTFYMRQASIDKTGRKLLITFDGSIEPDWVENMNSVLDDNMRLTLITGESIYLTPQMAVVLETADLADTSPATISRCAIVYQKLKSLPLKAQFNKWLLGLPQVLKDQIERIDVFVNFFMSEIFDTFMSKEYLIYPVTKQWMLSNFIKVFNSLIYDYSSQKHKDKKLISALSSKGLFNKKTPNMSKSKAELRGSLDVARSQNSSRQRIEKLQTRVKQSLDQLNKILGSQDISAMSRRSKQTSQTGSEKNAVKEVVKPPDYNFRDNDVAFENSLKKKPLWIESMLIQSLLLSVGSLLNADGKVRFDLFIRETVEGCSVVPSQAKKRENDSDDELVDIEVHQKEYVPTETFVMGTFKKMSVQLPNEDLIFEYFFDTISNKWQKWESVFGFVNEEKQERTAKNIFHMYINTIDCLRYNFVLERMNAVNQSLLLVGPTAVGKSWVFRNFICSNQNSKQWNYKMLTCSSLTQGESFASAIEQDLINTSKQVMQPPNDKHLLVLIDDINLPKKDKFGIQSCSEVIRQWFDHGGWYNVTPVHFKQIKQLCLFATLSVKDPTQEQLTRRFGWHWATVGFQNESGSHIELIFQQVLGRTVLTNWPKHLAQYAYDKIQEATFVFFKEYNRSIPNTPSAYLKLINQRHCLQIINSIVDIYPQSIRNQDHIAQLWLSEVARTVIDRYEPGKDKIKVYEMARNICHDVFGIHHRLLPNDSDIPHYCYGLPEFEDKTYIQMPNDDYKKLGQLLNDILADYNKHHFKNPIDIVIFNTIIEKTIKINRSLYVQNAISILIAEEGSGSNQIVKMAIHMAKSTGQELLHPAQRQSSKDDHRIELKQILLFAATESKHQVVLNIYESDLHQAGLLEDLNAIAAHGELTELFQREELDNMINMTKLNSSGSMREKEKSKEQVLEELRQKCREDLKILIQLTPRADVISKKLRNYLHIVNSACIIQFGDWSRQGFEFIAKKYLMEHNALPLDHPAEVINQMIDMYADSCEEAYNYYEDTEHYLYIQAQHFENFCSIYKEIFSNRMIELTAYKDRFSRGLNGIEQTEKGTAEVQDRLSKESPKLVESQKLLERKLEQYDYQKALIGEKIKTIFTEEADLSYQFEEARRIRETCERNLLEVIPVLNDAIEGLLLIKREDIDEIKSYKNPTLTLRTLMQAVCIVLRVPPVLVREKENNFEPKEDYWVAALGPQVLGDRGIIKRLSTIEPKTLDADLMIKLEQLCEREELQPEKVKRACSAAYGINKWLRAVRDYFFVYKTSVPTRDKMILSEIQFQKIEAALNAKREEIRSLEESLGTLRRKFALKEEEIRAFKKKIEDSFIMRSKASRLLNALIGEKQKWSVFESVAINKLKNIEGDSLIAAAVVCFLAPFSQVYRESLFAKWTKRIEQSKIPITKELDFNKQFGDPLIIKKWIDNCLSNDSYSIQNAIVLHLTQIQSILIDPQGQANKWLRNQIQDVQIINMETSKYQQELSLALRIGSLVLLENVGDVIPRKLYPIFKLSRQKHQVGKQRTIILDNAVTNVHQDFKIYVTTLSKTPDYGSELSLICNFINFSVTQEAFTQQILSLILQELEAELDDTQKQYRKKTLGKLQEMKDIEEDILDTLREGKGDEELIAEQTLIEKLNESSRLSKYIAQVLYEIEQNMKKIHMVSAAYKPAADRVKQFFFLAMELNKLNPMYVFTHEWFLGIFTEKLKELVKLVDVSKKFEWIQVEFTRYFYEQICQTIQEPDKLLFSFLLAYKCLEIECKFDMRLIEFFIKGPLQETQEVIDVAIEADASTDFRKTQQHLSNELHKFNSRKRNVPWISKQQWIALDKLSQIAPFNTKNSQNECKNLSEHIERHPDEWLDWLNGMVRHDYTLKDQEYLAQLEEEEKPKPKKKQSDMSVIEEDEEEAKPQESSDSDEMVRLDNKDFFLKRVDTQRMLGLLIPGGYEESNFLQEQIQRKKNQELNKTLLERLRAGFRKLVGIPEKQFVNESELDQIFAYDLDSDNNNTDIENPPEEENINKDLKGNTVEEDQEIAKTIMDGMAQYTEFKVEPIKNRKEERRRFRMQTIIASDLSKLCIMRCFHPEKIMFEIRSFIQKFTGPRYIDSPNFDWLSVLKTSRKFIPTIFMVGPNVNAYEELKFSSSNLVQYSHIEVVYQPVGSISNEKISKLIIHAACSGKWLLLDNLHLQLELLPNIQKFIEVMVEMHHVISKRIRKDALKSFGKQLLKQRMTKKKQEVQSRQNSDSSIEVARDQMPRRNLGMGDNILDLQTDLNYEKEARAKIKEELASEMPEVLIGKIKFDKKQQRLYVLKKLGRMEDEQKADKAEKHHDTPEDKDFRDLKFPESFAFPIHKEFRLWLSTIYTPDFPISFARKCNKVSLQLPTAIRQNCVKTLNQTDSSFFKQGGAFQVQFRRLFFSMVVMHAVINQRERFGSFGWTQPYSFSPNDIKLSLMILAQICNQLPTHKNIPIELLQYCVGHLGYGGNVTCNEDKHTLMELIKTFIHSRVYTQVYVRSKEDRMYNTTEEDGEIKELYDLTGMQLDPLRSRSTVTGLQGFTIEEFGREKSYFMPKEVQSLSKVIEYVRESFPIVDRPQIFGLHPTATIKSIRDQGNDLMHRVYVHNFVIKRPKRPMFTGSKFDEKQLMKYESFRAKLIKIQFEIPNLFKPEEFVSLSVEREKGLNALIHKEIFLYNNLIARIHENLDETLAAIDGVKLTNERTDNTFECIQYEKTPREWLRHSYPANNILPVFVQNLKQRVAYIRSLLEESKKKKFDVQCFWLPGFFDQRNFLTTLIQISARKTKLSIETLTLSFRFMEETELLLYHAERESQNIFYINGLWIYGAVWGTGHASLEDLPNRAAIGNPMPTIEIKIVSSTINQQEPSQMRLSLQESNHGLEINILDRQQQATQQALGQYYMCPLYVNFQKNRILNKPSEHDGQLITTIPVPIKHRTPSFWVKRAICLLCYNEDITDNDI